MTTSPQAWVPDACTLPTADRPLRVAEFDDLFTSVRGTERVADTTLRLTLDRSTLDFARDLAARESECCSFFDFSFTTAGEDTVTMQVTVPPAYTAILDGLVARLPRS
jgi:hypothetical protein